MFFTRFRCHEYDNILMRCKTKLQPDVGTCRAEMYEAFFILLKHASATPDPIPARPARALLEKTYGLLQIRAHAILPKVPHVFVDPTKAAPGFHAGHKMEFSALCKRCWGRRFWARGHFSTTYGNMTADVITHYLELHSFKRKATRLRR